MEIKAPAEKVRQSKQAVAPPTEGMQTNNGSDVSRANKETLAPNKAADQQGHEMGCRDTRAKEAQAVVTRAQAKKAKAGLRPLTTHAPAEDHVLDVEGLKQAQREDTGLEKLWKWANENTELHTKGHHGYRYEVRTGVLYRIYQEPKGDDVFEVKQVVVPRKFRNRVMSLAHESIVGGHLGVQKTFDRITSSFHWPGILADVTRFCRSCDVCQRTIPKGRVTQVPLGEIPLIDEPFSRVAIDLVGPIFPTSEQGNRYILTLVDFATRYPEAVALLKIG